MSIPYILFIIYLTCDLRQTGPFRRKANSADSFVRSSVRQDIYMFEVASDMILGYLSPYRSSEHFFNLLQL